MGIFNFIKEAGEKLFKKDDHQGLNDAEKNKIVADSIKVYIEKLNLNIENLAVSFDLNTETVILSGTAQTKDDAEKAVLAAGNVNNVTNVENKFEIVNADDAETVYHDVVKGDTLSSIAKKYYGDANLYNKIFEANKPMLSDPNKIYVGQKLRIPK